MDYKFKNIESLIRDAIDSIINFGKDFKEQFTQVRTSVSEEKIRAKKSFVLHSLTFDQRHHVTRYVQFHQQSLIDFSDELSESASAGDDSQLLEMINFFCDQLNDILTFLQNQFAEHFNIDVKVPESFRRNAVQLLKIELDKIKIDGSQIDQTLFTISIHPIQGFLDGTGPPSTYRTIVYLTELSDCLLDVIRSGHEVVTIEEQICSVLVGLNYNRKVYFEYYINRLKVKLAEIDSVSDQLEKFAYSYKVINQIQYKQGSAYNFRSRPLKDQLSDWLLEEIQYLERKRQIASKSAFNEEVFVRKEFKLEFDMSVSQFAYFIKAFVESGVIQNKNISELMRFFTKFVKSRKSQSIGYESLHAKYYNVENSTKDSVKNLLHTTIGYINSN